MHICPGCEREFQYKYRNKTIYCSNACSGKHMSGRNHPQFKERWYDSTHGYFMIHIPGRGHVKEHRYIIEQYIGRELTDAEVVHHRDGRKWNNDISNLEITNRVNHARIHNPGKGDRWSLQFDCCQSCGTIESKHDGKGRCKRCAEYRRRHGYYPA